MLKLWQIAAGYAVVTGVILAMCAVCGCQPCYAKSTDYRQYRLDHCEVNACTNLNLEAHHILAKSQFPEYADGQGGTNIITLCRYHHVQWGHCGNTSRFYNIKIRKMVDDYNSGQRSYKKYENTTDKP